MIRSQSISNFGETKKKPSFFSSLRTRKLSKDLNSVLKARPLSQSSLAMNLNVNAPVASKRHSVLLVAPEDKENAPTPSLRKHSSASKLNESKRNSIFMRNPTKPREKVLPISPPSDIVSVNSNYLERPSPFSPVGKVGTESYDTVDSAPINLQEFDKAYIYDDEPCSPSKLRRTTNISNIHEFLSTMDDSLVPMCNRASLEFEANEIDLLQKRLTQAESLQLKLVENVTFLSCFGPTDDTRERRPWDEDDLLDAIKNDPYSDDEDISSL